MFNFIILNILNFFFCIILQIIYLKIHDLLTNKFIQLIHLIILNLQ